MDLSLKQVDIAQSFTQLDLLKNSRPIAGIINGKLNSTIKLNGNLDATAMRPDLKTVTGDLGQLLSTTLNATNSTLLTALGSNLKFIDANKINLNNLKAISFKDGMVSVKPLTSIIKISKRLSGKHGFDQMNYNIQFNVPVKYLGRG
jgi:DNA mismatch repair protein MutH